MAAKLREFRVKCDVLVRQVAETFELAEAAQSEPAQRALFRIRYTRMNNIYEKFEEVHYSIISHLSNQGDADYEAEDVIRKEVENNFYCTQVIYDSLFTPTSKPVANNAYTQNVRLPKIPLRTFNGNFGEWTAFVQSFNSAIHSNAALADVDKFQYLLNSLSGEPLSLIKSLTLSAQNYPIAYQCLIDRYENKRKLATHYWKNISSSPKLQRESAKELRGLVNNFREGRDALKALNIANNLEDFLWTNLILEKLDTETRRLFEVDIRSLKTEIPTFERLMEFLESQCRILETVGTVQAKGTYQKSVQPATKSVLLATSEDMQQKRTEDSCSVCESQHAIYGCKAFLDKTPQQRFELAKAKQLCINCLRAAHRVQACRSKSRCRKCKASHHTLLHFEKSNPVAELDANTDVAPITVMTSCTTKTGVLLATALLRILDARGNYQTVRAILDNASQGSFVTLACLRRLGLRYQAHRLDVTGIGSTKTQTSGGVLNCDIVPAHATTPACNVSLHALPKIADNMPSHAVDATQWVHLSNLSLADPHFAKSQAIDLLLGADIYAQLLLPGIVHGTSVIEPSAINTIYGWVVCGPSGTASTATTNTFFTTVIEPSLVSTLQKFWEIEEPPTKQHTSPDDAQCERLYIDTVQRDDTGRYTVSLPFAVDRPTFGNSRPTAMRRFLSLERRLAKQSELKQQYAAFMQDYLDCKHMEPVPNATSTTNTFYIPHHCVLKPESTTTKLRVVFDASAQSNGPALNDLLLPGPKLQRDIVAILLNFRLHAIAFVADIKQMFRQIWVSPADRDYQRILWRFSEDQPITEYRLNTVSFGVTSSPYLAIRTLQQLAIDEKHYPDASAVLETDSYVDDIVTGGDTLQAALALKQQLSDLLGKGGFELRKWLSNDTDFLASIPDDCRQGPVTFDEDCSYKILGLHWLTCADAFSYNIAATNAQCTKRAILSDIARIFDPLGFLSPLTLFAKQLIQTLWTLGVDWDDTAPPNVVGRWTECKSQLPDLAKIQINRHIALAAAHRCELHGFADASEVGFAAVIYIRTESLDGPCTVQIIIAKSKVSPLKRVSIPRLELCAAVLLANLIATVKSTLHSKVRFDRTYAWTDSKVALAWIKSSPHRWKTFIANRVSSIQDQVPPECWYHVRSEDNPADCASRGVLPFELLNHSLWWSGPAWLRSPPSEWPTQTTSSTLEPFTAVEEEQRVTLLAAIAPANNILALLERYSSLAKIKRIIAYCCLFANNCRTQQRTNSKLSELDLHRALMYLVKLVQEVHFEEDLHKLRDKQPPSKQLRKLSAFLDDHGVLRVGGRLAQSNLSFESKHPALLPSHHRLTYLIIEEVHREALHPGCQTLLYLLLQRFWILSPRRAIRRCLSRCYQCFRTNPTPLQPAMGDLPSSRVGQLKPFQCVGVDYGGPYSVTLGRHRGTKSFKAYICLFVCFATKAVHIELASDLTSEAFLAALRRFIARRGRCSRIYSDCGTNFVGANKELLAMTELAAETERIEWRFNPPSAPHFGGLWEAGIKSVKTHLRRVIGEQLLTYEELYTVLVQVEAVLNSRPLCSISSDANDLTALTPGHFLTLEPLTSAPDPDLSHLPQGRLNRWQLVQRMHQDFWKRWHSEYLHTLSQRGKWLQTSMPVALGTLVLIKEDSSPPLRWKLGRITALHPGKDDVCRVATLRTTTGTMLRPLVKLCPLPAQ